MASGIWGLVLEPGKRYSKSVDIPFHITLAALDTYYGKGEDDVVSVMLEVDGMEVIICNLSLKRGILQCPLNLKFVEGSRVAFYTTGSHSSVHLSGNITSSKVGKCKQKKRKALMENAVKRKKIKKKAKPEDSVKKMENENNVKNNENGDESDTDSIEDDEEDELSEEEEGEENTNNTSNKTTKNIEIVQHKAKLTPGTAPAPPKSPKVVKQGGITCEDLIVGKGKEAKKGNAVFVYYEGRLASNDTLFDKCLSGKPFKFRLGGGEVIPGWDIGVAGMKTGGKRKLVIPPHMAYGKRGAPPVIPPQAALKFVVTLKNVV
ncbi:hypothetical protein SK128_014845 [Halocaridina rubra]|uniref:peptidylprolyl isomerase n=1 Tax=Halocaridina rubra TaxID=373956 RepID=A0AAN8XC00_HALRR